MRAATYMGGRTFAVEELQPEQLRPSEVRVRVAYTGVCGTDLHVFHGDMDERVKPPAVLGHEASGRIAELGEEVTGWSEGDPVTVMPLLWCGDCGACRGGFAHICERLVFVGLDSAGSMQEYWNVPASLLVKLPDDMPLEHAALVEPAAVAVHDVHRANLRAGEHAVVVGGGPIGTLIALVARATGAEVVVSEPNPDRRQIAGELGLETVDPTTTDLNEYVRGWAGSDGSAVSFEVSGSEAGLAAAAQLLAPRGRLVVVGIHPRPVPVDLHRVFWRELSVIGARVYERTDFELAVDLVHAGEISAPTLISRIEPLSEAARAFEALDEGGRVMKILLDCQAG